MAQDFRANYRIPEGKLTVIHNPVDFPEISRLSMATSSPFSETGPNILAVGRIHHVKGYDLLLKAFADSGAESGSLHIVGDGDSSHLQKQAHELGVSHRVLFHGQQRNPYAYMRNADALVLSSRSEASSNVLLEAMACRCPTIAFDGLGGINEVVAKPQYGILVPHLDISALASALRERSYRTVDVDAAFGHVAGMCSLERVVAAYSAILNSDADAHRNSQ